MRICPFISHMISDDWADALGVDLPRTRKPGDAGSEQDVAVLGYEGDEAVGLKTEVSKKATDEAPQAHLLCLKEPCRFYMSDGRCQFDAIMDRADDRPAADAHSGDEFVHRIERELDKIWKFQTKSVTELVATIGEGEERQRETLTELKRLIERAPSNRSGEDDRRMHALEGRLAKLMDALENRDKGVTNLSTSISEVAMGVDESVRALKKTAQRLEQRLEELESSLPGRVEEALSSASAPDTGSQFEPMADRVRELMEMNRRIEGEMSQWQETLEAMATDASDTARAQEERMDRIVEAQRQIQERLGAESEPASQPPDAAERRGEAKGLNNQGVARFHDGDLEGARDCFRDAVEVDDTFAESHNNLGLVYTELGEDELATAAFRRAIELNPDLNAAYNNLGYLFYKRGEYEDAIETYNEALGRDAASSSSYTNLGNAYYQQGNRDAARNAWEKALELDPADHKAASNLEKLSVESNEPKE